MEAIVYYNRSLSVLPIPATYNNRALACKYCHWSIWQTYSCPVARSCTVLYYLHLILWYLVIPVDIRASKWSDAVTDCNRVLKEEPDNIKAKLRRACAYKSLRKFRLAKDDLDEVLLVEPQNKRARVGDSVVLHQWLITVFFEGI